jgi:hypothetical protein
VCGSCSSHNLTAHIQSQVSQEEKRGRLGVGVKNSAESSRLFTHFVPSHRGLLNEHFTFVVCENKSEPQ